MQYCVTSQPSPAEGGEDRARPCPEDGEFHDARPDTLAEDAIEEAMGNCFCGLKCLEKACFQELHTVLGQLPVPVK